MYQDIFCEVRNVFYLIYWIKNALQLAQKYKNLLFGQGVTQWAQMPTGL